jgi:uncharacterized membrane protein
MSDSTRTPDAPHLSRLPAPTRLLTTPLTRPPPLVLAALLVALFAGCGEDPPPLPDDVPTGEPAMEREEAYRGVALVASGWEPGWRMEIERGGSLTLTPVFGMDAIVMPAPEPDVDSASGVTTYGAEVDALEMEVHVLPEECQDARSLELFEVTVHVRLNGRELAGCGSWLVEIPEVDSVESVP